MRVLIACEFSGIVRDAFTAAGHEAWSCDLLPTERPGAHFTGDVRWILGGEWDLLIAHPPCTHLAVSGARWFPTKLKEQEEALRFVRTLLDAPIERIALENPRSIISTRIRKKDQSIQPYQFGEPEIKTTWLWLKGLPPLRPTNVLTVPEYDSAEWRRWNRVHRHERPGPDRWKNRSRTLPGIARAMAEQWGARLQPGFVDRPARLEPGFQEAFAL